MGERHFWSNAGALAAAGVFCLSLSLHACKRKAPPPPRPVASTQLPNDDPHRFAAATAGLAEHWRGTDRLLPDCTPLLAKEAERASCVATLAAVTALSAALARGAPPSELMPLAGTAALAAQRAAQRLRKSGVARLFEERQKGPSASASASPSASAGAIVQKPARPGHPPAHPSVPVRSQGSRDLDAITAYARVATLGLRHLAIYLEFGPLALRQSALAEIERLAREEPHWAALRALVSEALLVESDAGLKRDLTRVRDQLG